MCLHEIHTPYTGSRSPIEGKLAHFLEVLVILSQRSAFSLPHHVWVWNFLTNWAGTWTTSNQTMNNAGFHSFISWKILGLLWRMLFVILIKTFPHLLYWNLYTSIHGRFMIDKRWLVCQKNQILRIKAQSLTRTFYSNMLWPVKDHRWMYVKHYLKSLLIHGVNML